MLKRSPPGVSIEACKDADEDILRHLFHLIEGHMARDDLGHVLPITLDQLGETVGLPIQNPVDNLLIIVHRCLRSREVEISHNRGTDILIIPDSPVGPQHAASGGGSLPCIIRDRPRFSLKRLFPFRLCRQFPLFSR